MKKIWVVVIAVACAGVFFYVGMVYGKSAASGTAARGNFAGFASSTRGFGRTGGTAGATGGVVAGQVIAVDADSVTVQLANGNSQVVFYSSSTQIEKPSAVPASSLTSGTQVMIVGSQNSDGSLTAQSIQVRPAGTGGFFGGGGAGSGGSGSGTGGSGARSTGQ